MYSINYNPITGAVASILRTADGASIPLDPRNRDYQAFLAWNAAQQTPLDLVTPNLPLSSLQSQKIAAIDANTQTLLAAGFAYNGSQFSLSDSSKINWTGLMISAAGLTYPFMIADTSGNAYHLTSAADVQAWYVAGLTRAATIEQGGVQLKTAVQAATTAAGVNAVVDNRS